MATVNRRISPETNWNNPTHTALWEAMASNDDGAPVQLPIANDRSVQITGTFGGATVLIEGSNDGVNYVTLTDPQGNALSFVSGGLKQVLELTAFLRPRISGGNGTTSVNCTMLMRRRG